MMTHELILLRPLKDELQGELEQAGWRGLQDLAELRRCEIVLGKHEIGVVEQVKGFRSELQAR